MQNGMGDSKEIYAPKTIISIRLKVQRKEVIRRKYDKDNFHYFDKHEGVHYPKNGC
jgi:hypothetical protein